MTELLHDTTLDTTPVPDADAGTALVVSLAGDLDTTTQTEVGARLLAAAVRPSRTVVVDLTQVDFMDCAGLTTLLRAQAVLGDRLALRAPSMPVDWVLTMTGTRARFTVVDADGPQSVATAGSPAGGRVPAETTEPGSGAPDGADSSTLARAAGAAVDHLHDLDPETCWVVTRADVDGRQVVVAAAGARVADLVPGVRAPWSGAEALLDGAAASPWAWVQASAGRPLLVDGAVAGTVRGFSTRAEEDFGGWDGALRGTEVLLSALLTVSARLATAERSLQTAQELAEVDVLTGLRNRRGWQTVLSREETRCARYGSPAGVVVVDLDGLKQVNDADGHARGDALLRTTADVMATSCRPSDGLARTGGDEFAVLAVEADALAVDALVGRLDEGLRAAGVAASVAGAPHLPGTSMASTWARADEAMYARKAARRPGGLVRAGS